MTRSARDRVDEAADLLGVLVERDVPIGPLTTYRVGGAAALLARPSSVDDLRRLAEVTSVTGLPTLVIGRGSNMLVSDEGFVGVAISLTSLASDVEIDDVMVQAGGAVALPILARRTVAAGLRGFEWAVGVPGTVGGGVRMNAGGHGSDIAAALVDVDLFDLRRVSRATVPADRLGLRFRGSDLSDHQVVLAARVRLEHGSREAGELELDEVVRWRRENQPGGQNAGSVFVNPVPGEVTAGALIDGLGLRGMRIGTAHVSDKHANFIQADDGGRASDVRAVIESVRAAVAQRTGYVMRSEVRLVGFADVEPDESSGVAW